MPPSIHSTSPRASPRLSQSIEPQAMSTQALSFRSGSDGLCPCDVAEHHDIRVLQSVELLNDDLVELAAHSIRGR